MDNQYSKAVHLRTEGKELEALEIFQQLLKESPHVADLHFQCAWTLDRLGMERQAVDFYKQALHLGLNQDKKKAAMLGLGSTYRCLGLYHESKTILLEAMNAFPNEKQFNTFFAMTLYNLEEYEHAMEALLHIITETTNDENIKSYKHAIEFYASRLDQTWD